jgi:hypothetical protein
MVGCFQSDAAAAAVEMVILPAVVAMGGVVAV